MFDSNTLLSITEEQYDCAKYLRMIIFYYYIIVDWGNKMETDIFTYIFVLTCLDLQVKFTKIVFFHTHSFFI